MSDDNETTKSAKPHRGGWPKGKPRAKAPEDVKAAADRAEARAAAPQISKMRAKPNWESDEFAGVGLDGVDRLHIPTDMVKALWRDGVALQWITRSVRGQEFPQEVSKMVRGGWTPVHQSDFDGLLDGMFMPKGHDDVITVDDCMLVARPVEIQLKAKQAERRAAQLPLQIAEDLLGTGLRNVSGGNHPTAIAGNRIVKSVERVEIPE